MRLSPQLLALSSVLFGGCSEQPSHVLMPTSHGLCVLSAPATSSLEKGDLVLGPGRFGEQVSRSQLFSRIVERSFTPIRLTVRRNGVDREVLATRTDAHGWEGLDEVQRQCTRVVGGLVLLEASPQRTWMLSAELRAAEDARVLLDTVSVHSDAPAQPAFIEQEGGPRLFARSVGHHASDPVVIVVNGGPGKSHEHMRTMELLADRGWTVVTYDQRGTGHSDRPEEDYGASYGFPQHAADLEAVREWTGHDRVILLGHSWGGPLVLDYLSRHPEHVAGTVVVGSGAVMQDAYAHVFWGAIPEDVPPIPVELDPSCISWWPSMMRYYPDPDLFEPEHLAGTCHDDINSLVWQNIRDDDVAPRLADVDTPILVWYGGYDPLAVLRPHLLDALPNADVTDVFIEDCGHRPMFQCPDAFYRDIEPWMNGVMGR